MAYAALIFAASSIRHTPALPHGTDKGAHALFYAGFGACVARAVAGGSRHVSGRSVLLTGLIGALYGVSDEWHQYFNPPRAVEALDVVADTVGSVLGAGALRAWAILQRAPSGRQDL